MPKVLNNSLLYSSVSFLQKGVSFFLLPIYTSYLTTSDYGTFSVIASISSFLSIFLVLSLNGAASRFHYKYENLREEIWGTISIVVIINSLIIGFFILFAHKYLIDPFAKGIDFYPLMFISILSTILNPLYNIYQCFLQTVQDGKRYSINLSLYFVIGVILNIVFLIIFKYGVFGLILSNLICSFLFFVHSLYSFIPKIKIKVNKKIFFASFRYSLPLLPHSVSSWLMVMIDRIMINNLLGAVQTGLFSIASQFGGLMNIITNSVNQAFVPWFYENLNSEDGLKNIYKFSKYFTIFYCFIALSITLLSPEVVSIMTTKPYHESWKSIIFISYGFVFSGLYYFFVNPLFIKNTKYVPIITIISSIFTVLLNLLLIPYLGIIGSGISLLMSLLISSIIALFLTFKNEPDIKYPWKLLYSITIIFILLSSSVFIIEFLFASIILKLLIKAVIILTVIFVNYYLYKTDLILIYKALFIRK